ncbi:Pentatricopeptide repeat [Dillenia turbinata]|uniref:Pentatricopeptide repeat n=1 Tax=Dillenia turbinata TaxID=194707 RepID=A0AAN8W6H2_9MAGN
MATLLQFQTPTTFSLYSLAIPIAHSPNSSPPQKLTPTSPISSLSLPNTKPHPNSSLKSLQSQSLRQPRQKQKLFLQCRFLLDLNSHETQSSFDCFIDECLYLLRLSVRHHDSGLAMAIHTVILKIGGDTQLWNSLVVSFAKLGHISYAQKVFDGIQEPDVVSYSALISGLAKWGREIEAIELFMRMAFSDVECNEYSFVAVLSACIRVLELELGFQIHALVIKRGYLSSAYIVNALMGLYGKCGCLDFVFDLLGEMPCRDISSWNTVISAAVKEGMYEEAFESFRDMCRVDELTVDEFTVSTLLAAATGAFASETGRMIHAAAVKLGFIFDLGVSNSLISFYTKCGSMKDVLALFKKMPFKDVITWTGMVVAYMEFGLVDVAVEIFYNMPERNSVSYNALLAGFCRNGKGLSALDFFCRMLENRVELTEFTLSSLANACGLLTEVGTSKQVHAFIIKFGFGSNACIEAALLDMCTKCGRMADAQKMFRVWSYDQNKSVIWTSMICGYARNGQPDEAISLFQKMQLEDNLVLDEVVSTAILGLCGILGFHQLGEQIHCYSLKSGFLSDIELGNAILSMYAKCGYMDDATKVFNVLYPGDVVSWNGLIAGHLLHRQGDEALDTWSLMEKTGIKPDDVTLELVISSYQYTKSNLVHCCRELFLSMRDVYNIEPTSGHYASLVSVLGKWGLLKEAEETIQRMPFDPDAFVWRALLDSCRTHSNTSIGRRAAKHILSLKPQDPSIYILVSNLYSASGRWHCSELIREEMREKHLHKHPGRCWIIHQNKVHSFFARDRSHSQSKDIYSGLDILILECLKAGYVPDTSFVLHEVEEFQKNSFLFYHSAKLAVTFGLLMTGPEKPIRIVKNIRLCGDCHTFFKFLTVVSRREIIVRDSSGFHCISNGQCSCKDHW